MKKSTMLRSLLMSGLSVLLCVSMLMGSTFAWFTDTVESGINTIVAGNLDVELSYLDGKNADGNDNWTDVEDTTALFQPESGLWEPGVIVYETFKVTNAGNLALKYQLGLNVGEYEVANLANVLKVAVVKGAAPADREAALALNYKPFASFVEAGELESATSAYYTVVIYWEPSDNDNIYKNAKINLGVSLFATQMAYEDDSFGSDYDEDAVWADTYVKDAAELAAAIENANDGDVIALMGDIVLTDNARAIASNYSILIPADKNVVINLNGNNISRVCSNSDINGDGNITTADNRGVFCVKGNLTVIGEGTLSMQDTGDNMGWNALSTIFSVEGGELTLGEGVTVAHKGGTDMAYAVDVNTTIGTSTLNVNGATLSSSYVGVRIFNNSKTGKGIVNYNSGIISGISRDLWAQQASSNCPVENAVVNTEIAYTTNEGGDRYYFTGSAAATDYASMKNAITNGATIVDMMGANINLSYGITKAMVPAGTTVTIKNATVSGGSYGNATDGTIIFENCTFTNTGAYSIHFDAGCGDVVFKNCTLYGWNSFGAGLNSVSFYDCALYGNGTYGLIRSYVDLYMENCYIDTTDANHTDNYSEGVEAVNGATLTEKNNTYVATTLAEVMAIAKKGNVTIDAKGANLGDFDYNGTFGNGTVLKNAKFTYVYGASIDGVATFENCEFVSDHSYSANFSDGSYTGKAIFNNCYFDGWNSFGTAITSVEMNNCTFDWNNPYSMLRFYQNAQLNDCNFIKIDGIDNGEVAGTTVTLTNCKGIEGKIYNNTLKNGTVMVSTWIVDGVVLTDVPAW